MRRWLPAVLFVLVTLFVGGSAVALNLVIARVVEVPETRADHPSVASRGDSEGSGRPARALSAEQYLDGIMGRNLFDVATIDAWAARRRRAAGGDAMARTELHVKLLGTMVAELESFSSALIADEDATGILPRAYAIGDELHEREVISIEEDRVGLKKPDGTIEYVTMEGGPARSIASDESGEPSEDTEGVREVSEGKYEVSRDVFDKNINDLEGISRMGRALLHRGPDGEFDGYRLSAIRRGTIADQLGIKNGDIIHAVNGESLNSVQSAMNAYNTMKTQTNFCFEISRRGSPTQLCYDVR